MADLACRLAPLLAAALVLAVGPAQAGPAPDVAIEIALTPRAAVVLKERRESIVLFVDYYGWPKKGAEVHADEVGRIDFGPDRVIGVPGKSGRHDIPGETFDPGRLAWVAGPVFVNVNVAFARLSGPDNLLDCDFIDEPLPDAARAVVHLRCGLIEGDPDKPVD